MLNTEIAECIDNLHDIYNRIEKKLVEPHHYALIVNHTEREIKMRTMDGISIHIPYKVYEFFQKVVIDVEEHNVYLDALIEAEKKTIELERIRKEKLRL